MAPQKRKRPHDVAAAELQAPAPAPTRRATRHNPLPAPAAEPASQPEHQLRSGRVRASAAEKDALVELDPVEPRVKKNDALKPTPVPTATATAPTAPTRQTRTTRHSAGSETALIAPTDLDKEAEKQQRSTRQSTPPRKTGKALRSPRQHAPAPQNERPLPRVGSSEPLPHHEPTQLETQPPSLPPKHRTHPLKPPRHGPKSTTTSAAAAAPGTATPKKLTTSDKPSKPAPPPSTPRSDRNIDKVVLGNICFRAWYPSYYGKEVLGDVSGNNNNSNSNSSFSSSSNTTTNVAGEGVGGKNGGKHLRDPPMLDRLYVCPCCFKYAKELVLWWEHVRCCETKTPLVPGRKVYTHPKGGGAKKGGVRVPVAGGRGKKKGEGKMGEEEEAGEWSVWEVDGEKDVLFCQNLSLFAKLFLDNKSVFFDVTGFNYFLLVYTPPNLSSSSPSTSNPATAQTTTTDPSQIFSSSPPQHEQTQPAPLSSSSPPPTTPSLPLVSSSSSSSSPPFITTFSPSLLKRPQIVGFFSKEKMSWDNNNLACILVFPPWQRKGLGALLMGVSYEISRREGILGGPEKPISELGRKGYKRFWAGEIARWLLGLDVGGSGDGGGAGETLVDVEMCARATWIVPEDCLAVLRDMGVVEKTEAGVGPKGVGTGAGAVAGANHTSSSASALLPNPQNSSTNSAAATTPSSLVPTAAASAMDVDEQQHPGTTDPDPEARKEEGAGSGTALVPRVRIDKEAVRKWVRDHGVELSRTCDPGGFVEGYAVKNGGGMGAGGKGSGSGSGGGGGGGKAEGEGDEVGGGE
ncbi:acyl-CoA N-acyltransferase [Camillea tinctor]|nr:acyl-CoA N-acyltransferase [Camillea tinctor]